MTPSESIPVSTWWMSGTTWDLVRNGDKVRRAVAENFKAQHAGGLKELTRDTGRMIEEVPHV